MDDVNAAACQRFDAAVAELQESVLRKPAGVRMSIKKSTPSHQIHNAAWKKDCYRVDVSKLGEILGFHRRKNRFGETVLVARCGGQVQMGQLVKATLSRGFVPKVVPEYTNFTVGGLINGEGIQTSSFKFGVFTHTVLSMTVMLGNGDILVCDDNNNAELFVHMVESYGTLGIVLAAEVELTAALPMVRSTYKLFSDVDQFVAHLYEATKAGRGAFLEGLVLRKGQYLAIEGSFTPSTDGLPFFDPGPDRVADGEKWYWQYIAQDVVGNDDRVRITADAIPTYSYLFRYMRGSWWMTDCHVNLPFMTKQPWFRAMCDKQTFELMEKYGGFANVPSNLTPEETQRCVVLQDMGVRLCHVAEGIRWVQDRIGVYPLWICPVTGKYNRRRGPEWTQHYPRPYDCADPENMFVADIGIYGEPTVRSFEHRRVLRDLQHFADFPSGWGVSYEDPAVVRLRYQPIREKYHAVDAFPGVEEKITFRGAIDDGEPQGKLFAWRLVREYGHRWPLKVGGVAIAVCLLLWVLLQALFGVAGTVFKLFF